MSEKDEANLLAILDAAEKIYQFTSEFPDAESFRNDAKTFNATLMNFIVIGEAVKRISGELKSLHVQIEWRKIVGFRDIVAQNYFGVDADEIWDIVKNYLPSLREKLRAILG